MIYTRWGEKVNVLASCGKHQPKHLARPVTLVRCEDENGEELYYYSFTLKADGGINEVEKAVAAAPEILLDEYELLAAMAMAD